MNPENEIFEKHHENQTKKGRGGKRLNSGRKSSGIEAITVRIDKRLLNTIMEIKAKFKTTESLDDIFNKSSSNLESENKKLRKQIKELESENKRITEKAVEWFQDSRIEIDGLNEDIIVFQRMIKHRDKLIERLMAGGNNNGIDNKLRKRLLQYCHPDRATDDKKAIATELTQALNGLAS